MDGRRVVRSVVEDLLAPLADLVLPRVCAGCGGPGEVVCPRCARWLTHPHLARPRRHPEGFPPTVAAGPYAGPVKPVVLAFKEHGRAELAGPLGAALALAVVGVCQAARDGPGPLLLVPVPSSRAALRERGRDHVGELTVAAVRELRGSGLDARRARLLARRGRVADSAGLTAADRRANLAGTFVPRRGPGVPPDALVVLVDDVVTSGATLCEAAAALPVAPATGTVLAAVVAATPAGARPPVTAGPGVITVRHERWG